MSSLTPLLGPLAGGGSSPERPRAVVVAGASLSDGGLVEAASALAAALVGAPAVAVEATPTLETVVAVVAGLLAGVPVVPIPADAGEVERAHLLTDSGAAVLVTTSAPPQGPGVAPGVEVLRVDVAARHSGPALPEPPAASPALILYTSGTTGPPKGVVLSRQALAAGLDALAEAWAWDSDDVVVHGLPLFHVHGLVLGVLGPLRRGGRLIHTGRPAPGGYAAAVEAGGTLVFGVPTIWSRMAADPGAAAVLRSARLLVSGSAPLPRPVFERIEILAGHRMVERYGMTETLITLSVRSDGERRPGWVGVPLKGVEARIVDEAGAVVASPEDLGDGASGGEMSGGLEVRGPTVMDGYLGLPERTAEVRTADGWLRTGDAAGRDDGGYYRIVGRTSTDLIKTGGYRVGAGEVEDALLAHPGVTEAAVTGVPDEDLGQSVAAWVVAEGVSSDELVAWVAGRLAAHKRPRRVALVASLPRNALGKIQKSRLGDF